MVEAEGDWRSVWDEEEEEVDGVVEAEGEVKDEYLYLLTGCATASLDDGLPSSLCETRWDRLASWMGSLRWANLG